jgi:hypothetical protein
MYLILIANKERWKNNCNILLGGGCIDSLATAAIAEESDNRFHAINDGMHDDPRKIFCYPLKENSPHIGFEVFTAVTMNIQ